MRDRRPDRQPRPLDEASLQALALHYAARYATTRSKLAAYLARKLKERPWAGGTPPAPDAIIARMAELGYVDDHGWAVMKQREMAARGLGPRRVAQALHMAGVAVPEASDSPLAAALRWAQRRRLGPFSRQPDPDPAARRRALTAMLRAGHDIEVARQVLAAATPEDAEALLDG